MKRKYRTYLDILIETEHIYWEWTTDTDQIQ